MTIARCAKYAVHAVLVCQRRSSQSAHIRMQLFQQKVKQLYNSKDNLIVAAVGAEIGDKSKQRQDHLCNLRLLHAKNSLSHAAPAKGEAAVPLDKPIAAAARESLGEAIAYADDENFYDAPEDTNKSTEGNDWVKENYCEGCDCEFVTG